MKHLFTAAAMLFSMTAFAQVGINNTSPKATLDITAKTTDGSKPEGLIIPQLSGSNIHTATAAGVYGSNQKGLIIYATSADSSPISTTANITAAGYYYFDGTNWQKISTGNTVSTSLASGNILVGSASNVATAVSPTGDVTISNTGATSIGAGKVTTTHLANNAVTVAKLPAGATATTFLRGDGTWVTPTDTNTTYTAGSGLTLTGTSFSANDATTSAKGIVQLAGDLTGTAASPTVAKIQNKAVSSTAPTNGQVLKYNTTTSAWEPAADTDTNTTYTAGSGLTLTGTSFSANDATTSAKGIVQLAGDLAGTAASPTVAKIQNKTVSSTAPTNGQVLKYNTTTSAWEPAADTDTNTTYTAGSGLTLTGNSFSANDATTSAKGIVQLAGDLAGTAASPTVAKIQNKAVSSTAPTNGQVLKYNTTTSAWEPAADTDTNTTYTAGSGMTLTGTSFSANDATTSAKGIVQLAGDLAGTAASPTVAKIQNKAVSSTAPTNGQVLKYNTTTSAWEPAADTDTNTTYTAGSGLTLTGTSFSANDATTSAKGIVQLAGDLTGTAAAPTIASSAVTSAKIADGTVANADLNTGVGGIYKGSGALSGGNTSVDLGTNNLAFTSTATNGTSHFTVDGTTFNVDAVNNRVGIGTSSPSSTLEINSGTANTSGLKFTNLNSTSSSTSNASTLGIDNAGNVVVQSSAPVQTKFKSFTIDTNAATNSLIAIGSLEFRFAGTTCISGNSYMQVRSTSGANNIGIFHGAFTDNQLGSGLVNVVASSISNTFMDLTAYPLKCIDDGHAQFSFFSYTDRTYYRVNVHIADGDSMGFGALGYIYVEYQK